MGKTTLLDIAKAVNVSKTTVSMVLNNKEINVSKETREKIFKAAKDMNYIPNSLARRRVKSMVIVLFCATLSMKKRKKRNT